jgi:hypothetical protein
MTQKVPFCRFSNKTPWRPTPARSRRINGAGAASLHYLTYPALGLAGKPSEFSDRPDGYRVAPKRACEPILQGVQPVGSGCWRGRSAGFPNQANKFPDGQI